MIMWPHQTEGVITGFYKFLLLWLCWFPVHVTFVLLKRSNGLRDIKATNNTNRANMIKQKLNKNLSIWVVWLPKSVKQYFIFKM